MSLGGNPLGVLGAAPSGGGGAVLIDRQVLTIDQATITFASIPQSFENLFLTVNGRCSDNVTFVGIAMQCNGDTAADYAFEAFVATGGTIGSSANNPVTSAEVGFLTAAGQGVGQVGVFQFRIFGYARTDFFKGYLSFSFVDVATRMNYKAGTWRSTDAINEILLFDESGGNFLAGTVASLYGEP